MNEASLDIDITKYNRVMADLMDAAGARGDGGKKFVKAEAGRLVETLMRLSPPLNRARSRASITQSVDRKFESIGGDYAQGEDSKHGSGGNVHWFMWTPQVLLGVAKEADFTKASGDEIYNLYNKIDAKKGRIRAGTRGKQAVRIYQKITVKASAKKKLVVRLVKHLGRLKAAYLPAFDNLQSTGNIYRPPQWVTVHRSGARGRFQDETSTPEKPSVVITNFANGVGKTKGIIRTALNVRIKAMSANMRLYIKGVKQKHGV